MKNPFYIIIILLIMVAIGVVAISHIKKVTEPTLKTDSPYTQDEPINLYDPNCSKC